ncbi:MULTISPECIES: hypothetical protein [unclassified Curtobacterium]|uniref:hypothetical protein n=1 Tax=unclassified Curtobacterium TaxID=257496 RepID=UPI003A81106C
MREPEWTPDQVALVLGVEAYDNSLGKHGQPWDEAVSPDSDPSNINGKRIYKAGVPTVTPEGGTVWAPLVDHAQRAIDEAQEAYKANATDGTNLHGLVWPVEAVDRSTFTS